MSKIVVAKLIRLGKDGDNFSKELTAKVERTNAKVDSDFIDEYNENWKTSGRLYVVDKEATEKRNKDVSGESDQEPEEVKDQGLEEAKARYTELFGKAPNGKMKLETMLEKIKEKENE